MSFSQGLLAITALNLVTLPNAQLDEAVPSFGASAVLIYGVRPACQTCFFRLLDVEPSFWTAAYILCITGTDYISST